jgi:hypothetical protein
VAASSNQQNPVELFMDRSAMCDPTAQNRLLLCDAYDSQEHFGILAL